MPRNSLDTPCAWGPGPPCVQGGGFFSGYPMCMGSFDPRAHGVVRNSLGTPCTRGHLTPMHTGWWFFSGHPVRTGLTWPVRTGSNGQKSPPGQEHYISPLLPPPTLNPNVLLSSTIATPPFAHYSQSLHPNLLKLWGLGEQDPIYTLTKPNRVPLKICSSLTCYSWSLGS